MIFLNDSLRPLVGKALLVFVLTAEVCVPSGAQTGAGTQRSSDNASVTISTSPGVAQDVTQRPTSTPYSGDLSIFEYPDRDKKLQIDRVMDLLGIVAGKNVADIGAGSGWFTVRASRRVGATGAVIAEDINPIAIEYIGKRALKEDLSNVRTVLGSPDDPRLPSGSVDAVLMLKVYHEIAHPVPTMKVLQKALRPGAKVGIIDRNGNGADHGLNHDVVVKEMGQAGYKLVGTYDFTKADGQDYFLIFQVR
ncbi:class I SAM-dependent methyltransferase [Tunturiibacter gelidoferens]|uniref:SAM-dependent methyltransferase n=1 Tax=Tunturiibacter gelidiferens TaxID=3069689 RepID=A0ACC5P0D3_9BACT|nr:class I SAM-dependent methyltransferase [Edaphobacter lichenicola]MBB5340298.1 SAM-dependent methyltransferase [Edaphobacter lichenicola]